MVLTGRFEKSMAVGFSFLCLHGQVLYKVELRFITTSCA